MGYPWECLLKVPENGQSSRAREKNRAYFSPLHKEGKRSPEAQAILMVWFLS
jgi:hypothetical protein